MENRVRDKKQVINEKILKTVKIVVVHMNLIDRWGKVELQKVIREASKLLEVLAQTNGTTGWKVKVTGEKVDQKDEFL